MKPVNIFVIVLFVLSPVFLCAQKITYSDFNREDYQDISFEILGKMNNNVIVYKNIGWKHILAFYNNDMKIVKSNRIGFIPDRTFNIDFISYPDFFYMVYQYQKNSIVHCKMVKMDANGEKIGEPVELDTTKIGIAADNKIYTTTYSDDKQKILVYKQQRKNERLTLVTKLYDVNMHMLDSVRRMFSFDDRRDDISDLILDNEGSFYFAKTRKPGPRDNISMLSILSQAPGVDSFSTHDIGLSNLFIDEVKLKVDNRNKNLIINSFFYQKSRGSIEGLFSALLSKDVYKPLIRVFNQFDDSLRVKINSNDQYRFAFDNFFLRDMIVKKDGGFIITAEDYYSQSRTLPTPWNRWDYLYGSPSATSYDYYLSNPSYSGFYRPITSFNNAQGTRYYYDNILMLSLDSSLKIQWKNIIYKRQFDDDNDNFLSFSTMNSGSEIHFLFMGEDRKNQIMYDHSVLPNGQMMRYATLKSREIGYEFMPRLAKQVAINQLVVPCVYRSYITFAKIDFYQ